MYGSNAPTDTDTKIKCDVANNTQRTTTYTYWTRWHKLREARNGKKLNGKNVAWFMWLVVFYGLKDMLAVRDTYCSDFVHTGYLSLNWNSGPTENCVRAWNEWWKFNMQQYWLHQHDGPFRFDSERRWRELDISELFFSAWYARYAMCSRRGRFTAFVSEKFGERN